MNQNISYTHFFLLNLMFNLNTMDFRFLLTFVRWNSNCDKDTMWKNGHKFLGQCIELVNSKNNFYFNLASHLVYYEY